MSNNQNKTLDISEFDKIDELSLDEIMTLKDAEDEVAQQYKPELQSTEDIEHVETDAAQAYFVDFDFAPHRLDHIVRIDEGSDLMEECRELARFDRKIVYTWKRDEKGRSDDETEEQKSADATLSEIAFAQYSDGQVTDETKYDYDCDVVIDDMRVDVKTTNIHSNGYNIPIRRYGTEKISESLEDKKERDYLIQAYSIRKDGFLYIGFEFAFDHKKALVKYPPEKQYRNNSWEWYNSEDGLKTWRTLDTSKLNMHLFNAKTARADDDITVPIEDLCQ